MLQAVISLGGLGFVLSVVLATAYAKQGIKGDIKYKQVLGSLPVKGNGDTPSPLRTPLPRYDETIQHVNCGACGFSECKGYADALVQGKTNIGECPVGGKELVDKLSEILRMEAVEFQAKVAILMCQGDNTHTYERFKYIGIAGCLAADLMAKGPKSCTYGCLGFGDCVTVCKFEAIELGNDGLPNIDDKRCTGCGSCVKVCPRNILGLVRKEQKIYVGCYSPESPNVTKLNCEIGCIECGLCEKSCPYDAIKIENGRAWINFEHCRNCAICVFKCPSCAIVDKLKSRPKAMIGTNCTGCEKCREVCPMKAIEGEASEQHKVIFDKCIGCALCYNVCEPQAITMAFSLGYAEV